MVADWFGFVGCGEFDDFSGLVFYCGFDDFFMLEVSGEDRDFI